MRQRQVGRRGTQQRARVAVEPLNIVQDDHQRALLGRHSFEEAAKGSHERLLVLRVALVALGVQKGAADDGGRRAANVHNKGRPRRDDAQKKLLVAGGRRADALLYDVKLGFGQCYQET